MFSSLSLCSAARHIRRAVPGGTVKPFDSSGTCSGVMFAKESLSRLRWRLPRLRRASRPRELPMIGCFADIHPIAVFRRRPLRRVARLAVGLWCAGTPCEALSDFACCSWLMAAARRSRCSQCFCRIASRSRLPSGSAAFARLAKQGMPACCWKPPGCWLPGSNRFANRAPSGHPDFGYRHLEARNSLAGLQIVSFLTAYAKAALCRAFCSPRQDIRRTLKARFAWNRARVRARAISGSGGIALAGFRAAAGGHSCLALGCTLSRIRENGERTASTVRDSVNFAFSADSGGP